MANPWVEGEPPECDGSAWDRLPPLVKADRPILILCEACQSEGRILTSDGGPYDTDNGECPICKGRGDLLIECEPITMEDLENV